MIYVEIAFWLIVFVSCVYVVMFDTHYTRLVDAFADNIVKRLRELGEPKD